MAVSTDDDKPCICVQLGIERLTHFLLIETGLIQLNFTFFRCEISSNFAFYTGQRVTVTSHTETGDDFYRGEPMELTCQAEGYTGIKSVLLTNTSDYMAAGSTRCIYES